MTSNKQLIVAIGVILSFLSLSVYAQSQEPKRNHFSTAGISFDYPAGYSVSDESTTEAQQLTITRKGSSEQLTIVALRRMVLPTELPAGIENLTDPMVKKVAQTVGSTNSPQPTSIQSSVGPMQAEGVRLQSSDSRQRTGEVIWLQLNSRLVAMAFVTSNADEAVESQLWQTVRSSLRVEAPVMGVTTEDVERTALHGGVLNGKALSLPKPEYPDIARAAHASGTVVVQILIDENGYVASARAISGHPLLQAACVSAARQARFSPTRVYDQPVKVTGVLQYNFISW